MGRKFREMEDETALALSLDRYETVEEKKVFGKIVIVRSDGKEDGNTYFTVRCKEEYFARPEGREKLCQETEKILQKYFVKYDITASSKILVVGLGNKKITADRLGYAVTDKIIATAHLPEEEGWQHRYGKVCALSCGVAGASGIESFDFIQGIVKTVRPDMLIVVDTLAGTSLSRLGCTLQWSDGGIVPGAGVGNPKKSISKEVLHLPVLSVGVPLVIYLSRILAEYCTKIKKPSALRDIVVSAENTDFLVEEFSQIIAGAINREIHRQNTFPLL